MRLMDRVKELRRLIEWSVTGQPLSAIRGRHTAPTKGIRTSEDILCHQAGIRSARYPPVFALFSSEGQC